MIGIIITGHGTYPDGVMDAIQIIAGDQAQIRAISFHHDTDKLENELEKAISEVETGSGSVCFADLAGGTPFNIASKLSMKYKNLRVIGGSNIPMILSGLFMRELDLDTFIERTFYEGKENMRLFEIKQKQGGEEGGI